MHFFYKSFCEYFFPHEAYLAKVVQVTHSLFNRILPHMHWPHTLYQTYNSLPGCHLWFQRWQQQTILNRCSWLQHDPLSLSSGTSSVRCSIVDTPTFYFCVFRALSFHLYRGFLSFLADVPFSNFLSPSFRLRVPYTFSFLSSNNSICWIVLTVIFHYYSTLSNLPPVLLPSLS